MFKIRQAREDDISQLLDIELDRYKTLYDEHPEKLNQIEDRFKKRISIASEWMWVLEEESHVLGFITGQPTDDEPEAFTSWEESTNNGTLEGKYFPEGKNVYVVNLDVKRAATKRNGQYLLMAALGAKLVSKGKNKVIFESRMPQFREWILNEKQMSLEEWDNLTDKKKQHLAEQYASFMVIKNEREVLYDRLLRFYENAGFTFIKVYSNAFEDDESLNFGVLCVGHNPVPKWLRVKPINIFSGWLFKIIGKNQKLFEKIVG